jgi:glycine betaine/proline transport system substrate-binding protein
MRLKVLLAAAALFVGTSFSSSSQACGKMTLTIMDWGSAVIVSNVAKFILEQGYGCEVTLVPSSTVTAMTSIAETGQPDVLTELWVNNAPVYKDLEADGKVVTLTRVLTGTVGESMYVPKYLVEKHPKAGTLAGILANPDLVGRRFHQCPEGWQCQKVMYNVTRAAEFEKNGIEVFQHGSGETMAASIASAFDDKKPWLGYYWGPTSILAKYPMVAVDLGVEFDADIHNCNGKGPDCPTPGISPFPPGEVLTSVTRTFADDPSKAGVVEFLRKMQFDSDVMGAVLDWQEQNETTGEEASVYFVQTYKDLWSGWLNAEARGNLQSLL